jgi:hypothetical protein
VFQENPEGLGARAKQATGEDQFLGAKRWRALVSIARTLAFILSEAGGQKSNKLTYVCNRCLRLASREAGEPVSGSRCNDGGEGREWWMCYI